jgi:phosphoribosylformylglycinamidine cyclo-ligase
VEQSSSASYRQAGVDIGKATEAVNQIRGFAEATFGTSGAGPIGHFGGVYRLGAGEDRLLVASADGVGTKLKLAFTLGGEMHARVGGDLVNHCVNDILACGARPLFFLDYVAMGALEPETLVKLVSGMATACSENGIALIGGETAEMPGLYADGEYDAAGFIVGMVAPERFVDGHAVKQDDLLIGLPSAGLHTNGYSLARMIVGLTGEIESDRVKLEQSLPGDAEQTVGSALMQPHRSYLAEVMPALEARVIAGMAHITGGGLIDNVPRMLPGGLAAEFDRSSWNEPAIFPYLVNAGKVGAVERYQVFNMGLGFITAVDPTRGNEALALMPESRVVGRVIAQGDSETRVRGLA